jgi:integrase
MEKKQEINDLLKSYWGKDTWDIRDPFFDDLRPVKIHSRGYYVHFSAYRKPIKDELKYMLACRLSNNTYKLSTLFGHYRPAFNNFAKFLKVYYPQITSIVDIPYDKAFLQWTTFLVDKGIKILRIPQKGWVKGIQYIAVLNQLHSFYVNFYDNRDEYEKDIWDCRKIPGAKITESNSEDYLNFTDIPLVFREMIKRYIKFRLTKNSQEQCRTDIMALRLFMNYIHKQEPTWKDLKLLTRKHMEDYLAWFKGYTEGWKCRHIAYFCSLRIFIEYVQRALYPEAPELASAYLLFKEDSPKRCITEESIKYIPEGVLQQLEDNLEYLSPSEFIPIVILLRASGWRISDILNLKYDSCLNHTAQGWYLCGDIPKTQVINHRVPITDEVQMVIQTVVDYVKKSSTEENNPNHLLFVRFEGKRKGRCPRGPAIRAALNRLAIARNIIDDHGEIFHFGNHMFRHTKGVELINNGMQLLHVQKWMAHASPEMTLRYAKILDTTMRKSWEEATKNGLFRINESGNLKKIDLSDIANEDIIEWEYIRLNLDAVRMPLGYCMKPKKQECHSQLNPCLTCRNLCTTPDFIPQYETEIQETKVIIERGIAQNRSVWVEKNQILLNRYQAILAVLKGGKIHHKAGKKGREYIGEERNYG